MIILTKWNESQHGVLDVDSVKRLHVPSKNFRISRYVFEPGERVRSSSQAGQIYVVSGKCSVTFADEEISLCSGDVAHMPSGDFLFEVPGEGISFCFIRVWELPEQFRT